MSRKWFYFKQGKAVGPVDWDRILDLYQEAELDKKSKIWSEGFSDWEKLGSLLKKREEESLSPPPLPDEEQQPPPLPKVKASPPPLPKQESLESDPQDRTFTVGPIQSKEDYVASKTITRASFVILSILGSLIVIGLISGGFEGSSGPSVEKAQKWPSSFGFENNSTFDAKAPSLREDIVKDIYYTQGYKIGQDKSVEVLSEVFPELAAQLYTLDTRFNSKFGASFNNIDKILSPQISDWSQWKEQARGMVSEKIDYASITKNDAEQFINQLQERVQGKLPSPVLETILMYHPKYISNPRLIFSDGYTKEYRSLNSPKAKGVDLAIEYPASWKPKEGRRPNVVQKFISKNGHGLEIVLLVIKDLSKEFDGQFTEEDILSLADENIWDGFDEGISTIDQGNVRLADKPTIWGEFTGTISRTGIEMDTHGLGFTMVEDGKMVHITFMVSQRKAENNGKIQTRFEHFAPVFQLMLNSLDFYDKYD